MISKRFLSSKGYRHSSPFSFIPHLTSPSPIAGAVSLFTGAKKESVDFIVIDKFEAFLTFLCFLLHFL